MPGNVALPNPVGVFPKHLSTKFVEKRAYVELQSQFHDSSIIRSQLALASRKSFSLAEKLTAAETATLKSFYDAHGGGLIPFFFYNPFEVCPPGTNYDPTFVNPVGRYIVRFGNDWDQVTGLMRTASPDMELIEISGSVGGSITEFPIPPTPGLILQSRPFGGAFHNGTALCSGIGGAQGAGSIVIVPSAPPSSPGGAIDRWCFSGLSFGAACFYSGFEVPYPSLLIAATITVVSAGGKYNSGPTPPPGFPANTDSTYDSDSYSRFGGIGGADSMVRRPRWRDGRFC